MAFQSFPKGKTRKQVKAAKDRHDDKVQKISRAACVVRDDACFVRRAATIYGAIGSCEGPSQWAHIPPFTRAHTRGQIPEIRHSTNRTAIACLLHHDMLDARNNRPKMTVDFQTLQMANGAFTLRVEEAN